MNLNILIVKYRNNNGTSLDEIFVNSFFQRTLFNLISILANLYTAFYP